MSADEILSEISDHISSIRKSKGKIIKQAHEKSSKLRQSVSKNSEKVKENIKKLIEETDPQLTEEGIKKIKFKSQFRSLRAMNTLIHFIDAQIQDYNVNNVSAQLTSSELNQFVRVLSKLLNDIHNEQATADSIMGLDYMLKKRSIYGPISKLGSDLGKLRTLQKEEFIIIKALEDLEGLKSDVEDISQKILSSESELEQLEKDEKNQIKLKDEIEAENAQLLDNPLIKNYRQSGIRMTELEIKIGRHLNSFKKTFKKYSREVQRGTISGDFGVVNAAIAYEKKPVQEFLKEDEGNPEIITLLTELIKLGKSNLRLKQKEINNLNQELNLIKRGNLDSMKKEWHELLNKKEKESISLQFKSLNQKVTECEAKLEKLKDKICDKEEAISLKKKEINQLSESLRERRTRASELAKEILTTSP